MAIFFLFFKQKTAYEMRISDWSSDVCSSDLAIGDGVDRHQADAGQERNARAHQQLSRGVDLEALPRSGQHRGFGQRGGESGIGRIRYVENLDALCEIGRASCRERVCQYV